MITSVADGNEDLNEYKMLQNTNRPGVYALGRC